MSLTQSINSCDLRALIAAHCGAEAARGLGAKGGTILDPRPGKAECDPSFSVWHNGTSWMWKKRGRNEGSGTAFSFLLSLGMNGTQARQELLRFTGTRSTFDEGQGSAGECAAPVRVSVLAEARKALAKLTPMKVREVDALRRTVKNLREGEAPQQDLARRGLWPTGDLQAVAQDGQLVFIVRGPDGRTWNAKRRSVGEAEGPKYRLLVSGIGAPAWCNPGYGRASRVLLVEGELNAAAAWRAVTALGLDFDVQGVAGADAWPFLEGLDREVWIYADGDASGERMRARLQDLAFEVGAPRVRQVPALEAGVDFCDVLGESGVRALSAVLHAEHAVPEQAVETLSWPLPLSAVARQRPEALLGFKQQIGEWPLMR